MHDRNDNIATNVSCQQVSNRLPTAGAGAAKPGEAQNHVAAAAARSVLTVALALFGKLARPAQGA